MFGPENSKISQALSQRNFSKVTLFTAGASITLYSLAFICRNNDDVSKLNVWRYDFNSLF